MRIGVPLALLLVTTGCPTPPFDRPPGPPRITQLSANPFRIAPGESTTLSWTVEGAQSIVLAGLPGGPQPIAASGTETLTPTATLSLTVLATGPGGTGQASVRVELIADGAVAIVRFDALPSLVGAGSPVEVEWETRNALQVDLRLSTGELVAENAPAAGTLTLRPEQTESIEIRADGPGGPLRRSRLISVRADPPRIIALAIRPPVISPGETAELYWQTADARHISLIATSTVWGVQVLTDPAFDFGDLPLDGSRGTQTVYLTASNSFGSITRTATLTVLPERPPVIRALTLTPTISGYGGDALLGFDTEGAEQVQILDDGQLVFSTSTRSGTVAVICPGRDVLLTVTALAGLTHVTRTATLTAGFGHPRVLGFGASPNPFSSGTVVTLSWTLDAAGSYEVRTELGQLLAAGTESNGSIRFSPATSEVLILTAVNGNGRTVRHVFLEELAP